MSYSNRHPISSWYVAASTTLVITVLVTALFLTTAPPMAFVWRWAAVSIILGIAFEAVLLASLIRRAGSDNAPLFWFTAFNVCNLVWQVLNLLQELSTTAQAASFWQGLMPIVAVPIGMTLLNFVLTYIDDSDVPHSPALRWFPMLAALLIVYVSGASNLIESHVPLRSQLEYWGFQSAPGPLEITVVIWTLGLVLVSLLMLIQYYRRTVNQRVRSQTRIFIWAISVYLACAATIDFGVYLINPHILPPMSFIYTFLMSAIILYGIEKFGLFKISAASQSNSILENLAEAVIGIDTDNIIQFSNTSAEILFGLSRTQLNGRPIANLFTTPTNRALAALLSGSDNNAVIESATVLDYDEHRIPVTLTGTRILDDRQRPAGYILVLQSMAELRKKALELEREKQSVERKVIQRTTQLHDEQAKLRASIESLKLGFVLADTKGQILEQNIALSKILGLSRPAKTLQEAGEKFPNFDIKGQCEQVLREARPVESDNVALDSKVLRVFTGPVNTLQGNDIAIIGTVTLVEDSTESKVLERSRDEFFSIASHELRTPLTAIKGNSAMLLDNYRQQFNDPDCRQMMTDIHDSSTHLIEIVNDFLDLSRLEQGKMSFSMASISLEPLIETVASEMKSVLQEKQLYLKFDQAALAILPPVYADGNRVKQIIYNLVGNACIYTEKGGLTIASVTKPNHLEISVTDTGRGISDESQQLLFHKFQQAGSSLYTRDTTRGTGLGLYISKLLATKMGGTVELKSSIVGRGSTFVVKLRRADTIDASDNQHSVN